MRRRQAGVSLFMVAIALILIIGAFVATISLFRSQSGGAGSSQVVAAFASAHVALEQYASGTGRLPCPANPALDTGDESPLVPTGACDFPLGTLPWKTIGARRDDAYDPWGWKISYRVYTGPAGSLTQNNGASMVQCTTTPPAVSPGTAPVGLCRQAFGLHTPEAEFLQNKGLTVTDFGAASTNVAYVLISHGPSGLGAWTSGGVMRAPFPINVAELANTTATGPFVAQAASAGSVDPASAMHFDDVLAYRTIPDLVRHANLSARDWAATTEDVRLNTATVSESLGSPATYGDLGRESLVLSSSTITAFNSGGNQNLSFDLAGGNEGLGGAGGGNGLSETGGEGLRIQLAVKARLLGVTLNDFGTLPPGTPNWSEKVQFRFIDSATSATIDITRQGCRDDGGLASFASLNAGFDFDIIEIRPLVSTADPVLGTTIPSSFFLSAFRTCTVGAVTCSSSLQTPANVCP
jgi:type II secretory pathway pseudopilin PulG